ncbi:uncharacterized protein LOC123549216 isoform X2 [Mercenaria mercenaria]|uniref:uncharacterized protein LOC123549216 isoform X2 n=1 Tax=Mercenaria mercenaria TaxID=6596 RepID=UPI001E1D93B1|nr:uncharacterized protein LOC123549216 isoform X2 [Mercenaria mercenaria]
MQNKRKTIIAIFLNHFLIVVTSYKCLQCDEVPLPNLCEEVGECGAHEVCAVEQYVTAAGSFRYRQSCRDKLECGSVQSGLGKRNELLTCSECCHGDLCNAAGCGEKGFDLAFGPICYACPLQIGTGSCSKIQQCGRDKYCSIHPVTRLGAPDNLFETKCTEQNMCAARDEIDSSAIVGRKRSTCSVCCNSTLCNDYDSRPCVPSTTTSAVNSVTTVTASPTTKTTSVHSGNTSPIQTVSTEKIVTSNGFTTAPVTEEVCEDAPDAKCHEGACSGSPKEYIEKNCRKTCKICGKSTATVKTTPVATSITTATSTASPSTVTSTPFRTSTMSATSKSGITGHTHDPFCLDVAVGCDQYVHFCTLDVYKDWTKTNCRRTCDYC